MGQYAPPHVLQDLKYQVESANRQLSLAIKASAFGKGDEATINELRRVIELKAKETDLFESHWLQEKNIVSDIIATRATLQSVCRDENFDPEQQATLKQNAFKSRGSA